MKITNKHGLPEALYLAALNDDYDPGSADISVTKLVGPPRIAILEREHWDQLEDDAMDRLWLMLGKGMHKVLEAGGKATHNRIVEDRMFATHKGWVISGSPDVVKLPSKKAKITDWKVTSALTVVFDKEGRKEWEQQINLYRWLLEENGYKVQNLHIFALFRDWKEGDKRRIGADYPEFPFMDLKMRKWSPKDLKAYLDERVTLHQKAWLDHSMGNPIVECTDEERWYRGDDYIVQKKGATRAYRTFKVSDYKTSEKAREAAGEFLSEMDEKKRDDYQVQVRRGSPIRCDRYCSVAVFCDQHQKFKQENPELYEATND